LEKVCLAWLVRRELSDEKALARIYGGGKRPGQPYACYDHLTGFTSWRLALLLQRAGFRELRRGKRKGDPYMLVLLARA